ncbi:hypothetical protein [Flavobacterium sp.]|uniref:hypothetical protein n=1 Tax=Flavobacterium sp. TaxID=239 RepID=UPI0026227C55|nr:hypothetical protein [Flavobacterium sp.]
MKYKLSIFIFLVVLSHCFSQENYDWNNIQKVELYAFEKSKKIEEYTSKDLNEKSLVKCDTKKIIQYLKELKMFKNDVMIENKFYALRVYFAKSRTDFILFLNQGVMFKLKKGNKYFEIDREFKKLIEDSTN